MKIFLIKEKQARSRGEYLYWNNEEGWSHKILATRFYEDNKEHLSFPIDGEWVEETDGPQYLPFHVNTSNQDDSEEGVQATSDEGKLYVRVGNIDIRIKQTDNGKGVKIELLTMRQPSRISIV
jgi:hypothetical protein